MPALNPFAQMPDTPEAIVAHVCQQLEPELKSGLNARDIPVEQLARDAVNALWARPVTTFIPVLAWRQVREQLREQGMLAPPAIPEEAPASESAATTRHPRRERDVLSIDGDVLILDERDVLRF